MKNAIVSMVVVMVIVSSSSFAGDKTWSKVGKVLAGTEAIRVITGTDIVGKVKDVVTNKKEES